MSILQRQKKCKAVSQHIITKVSTSCTRKTADYLMLTASATVLVTTVLLITGGRVYIPCLGTDLIHDFTAVTFSVKLAFFREKCPFPCFREIP